MVRFNFNPPQADLGKFFTNFEFHLASPPIDPILDVVTGGDYKKKKWVTVEYDEIPVFAFPFDRGQPEEEAVVVFGIYFYLFTLNKTKGSNYREDISEYLATNGLVEVLPLAFHRMKEQNTKLLNSMVGNAKLSIQ